MDPANARELLKGTAAATLYQLRIVLQTTEGIEAVGVERDSIRAATDYLNELVGRDRDAR